MKTSSLVNNNIMIRRKMQSRKLAAIYYRAGSELQSPSYTRRAQAVYQCSDVIVAQDGHILHQWRCKDRLCPICAVMQSRILAANAAAVLAQCTGYNPYFLTLTQRNCSGHDLSERISDMLHAWRAIMHDLRKNRKFIAGYARTIEITVNDVENTYHPHLHVLLLLKPDTPLMIRRPAYWSSLWSSYMGTARYQSVDPIVSIKRITPNRKKHINSVTAAAMEVSKYIAKSSKLLNNSRNYEKIITIDNAVHGRQLRAYGGIWRLIRAQLKLEDADHDDIQIDPRTLQDIPLEVWQWSGTCYQQIK